MDKQRLMTASSYMNLAAAIKSTCTVMARDRLVKVCSSRAEQIPLVLDKYRSPLIRFGVKAASIRVH